MKTRKILFMLFVVILLFPSATLVAADDFGWAQNLDIRAEVDPSGFRSSLSTRFNIGDAQVSAVLSNVEKPADAYMVFRLGEMSSRSTDYVMQKYKSEKSKGWGALAKSLGVKPGSKEFHALKRGSDIDAVNHKGKGSKKNKSKGKGKK